MEKQIINYETMLKVARSISHSKDPEEVALMTVESIKTALEVKACALFLFNRKTNELELATAFGLSKEYINKGPVSAMRSIAQSLEDGPVAIYDVSDDPRIQYPKGLAALVHDRVRRDRDLQLSSSKIVLVGAGSLGFVRDKGEARGRT